nr:hypothetical protein B0A51_14245 [Rachicladosporium sp. CCFEE 5018]
MLAQLLFLLAGYILAIDARYTYGSALDARADSTTTIAAPISVTPDQNWDGIDGTWSTFTLRVGTPEQYVRTYVSFASYQTWVIIPQGCSTAADESACAENRGWLFESNASSTWERVGIYDLWIEDKLDYEGNALYGYDRVGLGGQGEGGPTLRNTTVGGLAVEDFYLGVFGINPKPTNFSDFNEPSTSYMTQLKQQSLIPSVSFGYTAGAHYRYTGELASLTLGGYDSSKYVANDVVFTFAPDNERDIMVAMQQITTPSRISSSPTGTQLLPNAVYAYIDSTIPELWLPLEACQAFEVEFGLTWDNVTELYLVNSTLHSSLLQRNANVTFTFGQGFTSTDTVAITLPYAAFDLTAQPPFRGLQNSSRYFPLKRAANDSQYVLGRTLLQEAYITVDYEVSRFKLAQVLWDQNAQMNLVAIPAANVTQNSTAWTSPLFGDSVSSPKSGSGSSGGGIGAGAIAGIVVGVIVILAILAALLFWRHHRNKKQKRISMDEKTLNNDTNSDAGHSDAAKGTVFPKAELAGSEPILFGMTHHDADRKGLLMPPNSRMGTPGSPSSPSSHYGTDASSPHPSSAGEGTYMSSGSNTLLSPLSNITEADSKSIAIYEMPGDMPSVKEKDGRQLSEKEAIQRREMLYNGVDSSAGVTPTSDNGEEPPREPPRRVQAEHVVDARTGLGAGRHRAFSFEGAEGAKDAFGTGGSGL